MGPEVANKNKDCVFHGPYAGRDLYITMFQDNEREFVVTHNANIKPVSYFTGRETELRDLRQRIEEGRKSVLVSGMGGIGKTHICRKLFEEYLKKHAKDEKVPFQHIGYIEYNGDMNSSLQNYLKFKEQETPEQNQKAAWKELEYLASAGKLLLFVDNVDKPMSDDSGLQRLRSIPGAIILTSRKISFGDEFEPYQIGFLSTEQCKEIYEKVMLGYNGRKIKQEEAQDIEYVINQLAGRHTITVEFLAHLAWTKHWSVKKLRDELEQKGFGLKFRKDGNLINIQQTYEVLYDMSMLTKAERNILEAFSVFPYIPLSAEICNQWLLADAGVDEDNDILTDLYQKGWLQFDKEQEGYALHPVFSQFIYEKTKPSVEMHHGLIEACQECIEIPESGSILECKKFIPFAQTMCKKLGMRNDSEQSHFISAIAYVLYHIADYRKAKELYEKSLRINEGVLGEEHLDTAMSYNNLAGIFERLGNYQKARILYEKSLFISERHLEEEHPDIASYYDNLARVYMHLGDYSSAKDLYEKSLSTKRGVQGEEHPDTAMSYNNLAGVFRKLGEYQKAKELYEESLHIRERILGEEHLDTATSYNDLAGVFKNLGDYPKARELYEKSLRIREKVQGEEHPDVATCYNNLSIIYYNLEDYLKAKELQEKSLRINERVLGEEHPDTATSYNNLAGIFDSLGDYSKAKDLYEKGLRIDERVLGEEHPDTATNYNNLAGVFVRLGDHSKAKELYEKSLCIREKALGKEHPTTAMSYNNIAGLHVNQGSYNIALSYYFKAYRILAFKFGFNNPNTKTIYENMKFAYSQWNLKDNFEAWLDKKLKESD